MKKTLVPFIIFLSISPVFASIDYNLKYGQKGEQVTELQDFLVDKGLLTSSSGFFGLLTLKAVKSYQTSVGLPATGYVGSLTRGKINDELSAVTASSTQAEATEVGTTTTQVATSTSIAVSTSTQATSTVVSAPVIQYVYVPASVLAPVVAQAVPATPTVPAPTCTLTLNSATRDPLYNRDIVVDWTSTNASTGVMQEGNDVRNEWTFLADLTKDGMDNGKPRGNTLAKGTLGHFTIVPNSIRAHFEGPGGKVNCEIVGY